MKKIEFVLVAAMAVVSCAKENISKSPVSESYPIELTASAGDAGKLSLNGTAFSWTAGDLLKLRAGGVSDWDASGNVYDALTAASDGAVSSFTGTVRYAAGNAIYCFYGAGFTGTSASVASRTVSAAQTGKLSDLKDNAVLWAAVPATDVVNTGSTYAVSATMAPAFGLIKLNVAESLSVKSIEINGRSLAGTLVVDASKAPGTEGFISIASPSDAVTVSNGGAVLSGDIYAVVLAGVYSSGSYSNPTTDLSITFTNTSDQTATVSKTLRSPILLCGIKDLGNVTSLDFSGGKKTPVGGFPTLLFTVDQNDGHFVSVKDSVANCTFYIQEPDILGNVPDPTPETSPFFYARQGYYLQNLPSHNQKAYFKILIHTTDPNYSDAIYKCYYRNWDFRDNNSDLKTAHSTYVWDGAAWVGGMSVVGATYNWDGLMFCHIADKKNKGGFSYSSKSVTYTPNDLLIGPVSSCDAKVQFAFHAYKKDAEYARKIYINNTHTDTSYDLENASNHSYNLIELGDRKAGDWYGFNSSSKTAVSVYVMRILEVGEKVPVPEL